jgi:hypothetical protein
MERIAGLRLNQPRPYCMELRCGKSKFGYCRTKQKGEKKVGSPNLGWLFVPLIRLLWYQTTSDLVFHRCIWMYNVKAVFIIDHKSIRMISRKL